ncbi:NAD-dependent epimerase/dehydratase family protein [Methanoculleus sp. 10]|jgi:nucleoside-diphosphate-sugar epimerase|uniref:NAD-dependent epimerase/dehydratase family protein n=1 Tax=Methanoculleus sp. 10 TaxID=430615 RepID=UPI0025E01C3D|nr:NAD-dependent epimerase/dehydratase family protein [Methanoculleus sp. 10]
MRYIVTGGAGFIGSNLADTLAQNHDVVIIDNLATGRRVNIEHLLDHPRVTFIEGSISLEVPALRLQNRKSPLHR